MNDLKDLLEQMLEQGGWMAWAISLTIAAVLVPVFKIALNFVVGRVRKITNRTSSRWDDLVLDCVCQTRASVLFIWIVYFLISIFEKHPRILKVSHFIVVIATLYQVALWAFQALSDWRKGFLERKASEGGSAASAIGLIYAVLQTLLIITLVLIGLSNLGIDIGALVAGLGVGGIAVALAAQNVLGDLLASLSIVLDKPFVVGDFISVGQQSGTVENIGLKTTRVRALSGEQLVFSNKDLLESRIQNFKLMNTRRVVQKIGVVYSLSAEKLEQIPQWIKSFVEEEEMLKFDRCHLSGYGASSVDYELVYNVQSPDYAVHMDAQQRLLLKIYRKFAAEKVEFAFPTQTIFIEKIAGFEADPAAPSSQSFQPSGAPSLPSPQRQG